MAALSAVAISVVIPAYEEARRIASTLREVTGFLERRGAPWEVVVADDGSTDGTAAIVAREIAACPRIELVRLGRHRGKGAALRAGVAATRGARVLLMDADLSTPLHEIEPLWRAVERGAAIAVGSRAVRGADVRRPQAPHRVWLGRAGNLWIRALAVPGIKDTQCGFKLLDGALARRLLAACSEDGFAIDVELLCLATRRFGANIAEVGVRWEHRDGSRVRWRDYLSTLLAVPRIAVAARRRGSRG